MSLSQHSTRPSWLPLTAEALHNAVQQHICAQRAMVEGFPGPPADEVLRTKSLAPILAAKDVRLTAKQRADVRTALQTAAVQIVEMSKEFWFLGVPLDNNLTAAVVWDDEAGWEIFNIFTAQEWEEESAIPQVTRFVWADAARQRRDSLPAATVALIERELTAAVNALGFMAFDTHTLDLGPIFITCAFQNGVLAVLALSGLDELMSGWDTPVGKPH